MKLCCQHYSNVLPICAGIVALVTASLTSIPTIAQAGVLEEVLVVARKRQESLQETPIAVTAMNSDELRAAQITNVGDLSKHAPGLTRQAGSKVAFLSIRGVGVRSPGVELEPGVGVYVDSIYIPRNDVQLVDIIDAESVEVLRGPQGTLFGKNTAGGAVLITTKKPGDEFSGFAYGNVGDLDRRRLRAGVSGPLIDERLAGGIVIDSAMEDGYREDAFTGRDYGNTDRKTALGQLRYEAGDYFTGNLLLSWGETDENTSPVTCKQANPAAPLQSFTAPGESRSYADICDRSWALNDNEKVIMDPAPLTYTNEYWLGGLTLDWEIEDFTIRSITGVLSQENIEVSQDSDASNLFPLTNLSESRRLFEASGIDVDQKREFLSQELQLLGSAFDARLEYTLGLFYANEKIDNAHEATVLGAGGYVGIPLPNGTVSILPTSISFADATVRNFENTSSAIFGQALINLTEALQLTLGGRYSLDKKKAHQTNYISATPAPALPLPREDFDALQNATQDLIVNPEDPAPEGEEDWTDFSPSITLRYLAPDSWSTAGIDQGALYASFSKGFKAGGFSPFGQEFLSFEPETLWTGELGYKFDMWDSRIRLNGAFYSSEYDDIQIAVTRTFPSESPDLPPQTLSGITNAGSATISGAEVEFSIVPIEALLLRLSGSYSKAEYDEFNDESGSGEILDRSGENFAYIPEQTYSLLVQYDWDSPWGHIVPRIDGHYVSQVFIGLDALAADTPEAYLDSYTVWNFRLSYQPAITEEFEIAAYVNNFTDEDYFGTGVATIGGIGAVGLLPGKQTTYGIELSYRW